MTICKMRAKFVNEGFVLKPKSEDDIIKDLSNLTQEELNKKLFDISADGNKENVLILINAGAEVNATDDYSRTALTYASKYWYKDIIELLKKYGAK